MSPSKTLSPELTIDRTFKAPRELVFQCWTSPEHLERWQGAPEGFTVTTETVDIRPGGRTRLCMRSPEGEDHWLELEYITVDRPEKLVFIHTWLDDDRQPQNPTTVTITFTAKGGETVLRLHQTGFVSVGSRDGHGEGWESTLRRLGTYLDALTERAA